MSTSSKKEKSPRTILDFRTDTVTTCNQWISVRSWLKMCACTHTHVCTYTAIKGFIRTVCMQITYSMVLNQLLNFGYNNDIVVVSRSSLFIIGIYYNIEEWGVILSAIYWKWSRKIKGTCVLGEEVHVCVLGERFDSGSRRRACWALTVLFFSLIFV